MSMPRRSLSALAVASTAALAAAVSSTAAVAAPQTSAAQQAPAEQSAPQQPQGGPDFSKVQITTTPVAGNVYLLQGQGGNIAVSAGADGLLIVDDQFAPLADKIKAALAAIKQG